MTTPTLTGTETPLSGHVEPKNDEVIAVFRNGKLEGIRAPGERARALWMRYRPGTLTYARILRSDISFEKAVEDVAVQDGWILPRVEVQTLVALNPAGGYAALRYRLQDRGLTFMTALEAELTAEMDAFVRRLFAPRTHSEVLADPTPAGFGAREHLLYDLFVVDSVYVKRADADPQYAQMRTAVQGRKVDVEETARARAMAEARGLSLHDWENPDLVRMHRQQEHELAMAAQNNEAAMARLRVEAERDLARVEVEQRGAIGVETVRNIGAVTRATKSGAIPELGGLLRGLDSGPEPVVVPPAADGDVPAPVDDLNRDPQLMAQWKRAGGTSRAVEGLVRVEDDGAALVLLALDHEAAAGLDVGVLTAQAFPGEDLVVLPDSASLLEWVDALVRARAARIDDLQPVLALEQRDDRLQILVGSRNGRAGKVVKAILEPSTLIVAGLCALLPYEEITCSTARA